MAQPIVSPENLYQAVEEIKDYIDDHGGSSDYANIYTVISRRGISDKDKQRMYLAIDPDIDISDMSLVFGRYSRITDRIYDEDLDKTINVRHCSWHQIWAIPQNEKIPLFNSLVLKQTPWCLYNGKLLYEVTWEGYDSFWDFLNSKEMPDTGYKIKEDGEYRKITYPELISGHKCGIALVKDGKIISNYATFSGSYRETDSSTPFILNR